MRKNYQIQIEPDLWVKFGNRCREDGRIMYRVIEDLVAGYLKED